MAESNAITYEFTGKGGNAVRCVWAYVMTPKNRDRFKAKPQYEMTFLLPKEGNENLKPVQDKLKEAAKAQFGTLSGVRFPLVDGDKYAEEKKAEWAKGHWLLSTHAAEDRPPRLKLWSKDGFRRFDDVENPRPEAAKFFYNGVYCVPSIGIKAYDVGGNKVTCYLNECMSIGGGERLATGRSDEERYGNPEEYSKYTGHIVSGESPAEGMEDDDEIPF